MCKLTHEGHLVVRDNYSHILGIMSLTWSIYCPDGRIVNSWKELAYFRDAIMQLRSNIWRNVVRGQHSIPLLESRGLSSLKLDNIITFIQAPCIMFRHNLLNYLCQNFAGKLQEFLALLYSKFCRLFYKNNKSYSYEDNGDEKRYLKYL